MPTLRSGYIIVGAYADKVRRVAFAQLKDSVKEGVLKSSDIAYHVGQLNRVLYKILVEDLKLGKGDVVRISIDYEVRQSSIEWKFDTLKIEAFRRIPDEEVANVLSKVRTEVKAVIEAAIQFTMEKLGETEDGDVVYVMKLGDREVGAFIATLVDEDIVFVKKGAAIEPTPMIIEKLRISCEGKPVDEAIKSNIDKFTSSARYVGYSEAAKVIELVKKRVGVEYKVEKLEEVEE
ncbi:MAG: DUF2258 domain-containing protein [Desulfurococcaceae archaeon]|nr:DUF2258 domain-containing protein [Desulfurococcaceae archaeon]